MSSRPWIGRSDSRFGFANSGFTRHQQGIAARALTRGLEQAERADKRVVELEAELAKLRTMVAALVDHLAERGGVDMPTLRTRIAESLAAPDAANFRESSQK